MSTSYFLAIFSGIRPLEFCMFTSIPGVDRRAFTQPTLPANAAQCNAVSPSYGGYIITITTVPILWRLHHHYYHCPHPKEITSSLLPLSPSYGGYIITITTVPILWRLHHHYYRYPPITSTSHNQYLPSTHIVILWPYPATSKPVARSGKGAGGFEKEM